jgi:GTP-binding protein LepA
MELCKERRGVFVRMDYPSAKRVVLSYEMPLAEILFDFFDVLKSRSRGYASLDYDFLDYRDGALVKLDIAVNGEPVDALSFISHRDSSYYRGKALIQRLKEVLPRQMFEIRLQATLGAKVIAAERVPALRKNVLAKCYGGDVTRKRKLLEKQKAGKRRMKSVGQVEIPQEAFLSVLKVGND